MGSHELEPSEAWALLGEGRVQLIDLRGREESGMPRVPGAREIPLEELAAELMTLDRERPIVFLSGTGRRAADAVGVLRAAGVTASTVRGGMRAWLEAGLPAESGAS